MHGNGLPQMRIFAPLVAACGMLGGNSSMVSPPGDAQVSAALIEFRVVRDPQVAGLAMQLYEGDTVYLDSVPLISDTDLSSVRPTATRDRLQLRFQLTPQAARSYRRQTAANIGQRLALLLDGRVVSIGVIHSPLGSRGVFDARMPRQEAERLALLIRGGWRERAAGDDTSSLGVSTGTASAQALRALHDPPRSNQVTSKSNLELILGSAADSVGVTGLPLQVLDLPKGRFLAVQDPGAGRPPILFDEKGAFLRELTRRGAGPGELTSAVWAISAPGESLIVLEEQRTLIFDGALRHLSTRSERRGYRLAPNVLRLGNGSLVSTGLEPMYERRPRDVRFTPVRGSMRRLTLPQIPNQGRAGRILGYSADSNASVFWVLQSSTVDGSGYELLAVDTSSRLHHALVRRPDWWHARSEYQGLSDRHVPSSRGKAVREVRANVVMVLVAQPRPGAKGFSVNRRVSTWSENYETVVELVDITRAQVMAHVRLAGYPLNIFRDGRVATYVEAEDGTPLVKIWRVEGGA